MQIGNNRPNGPQPRDNNKPHLDPDLTKSNRDGLEQAAKVSTDRIQEAAQERAKPKPMEARNKPVDTFERSRPQDDPGMDVAARIKNARSQQMSQRIDNAREQDAVSTSEAAQAKGERIANARAQSAAQKDESVRPEVKVDMKVDDGAAAASAKRISGARAQSMSGSEAEAMRIDSARVQSSDAAMATRIQNARSADKVELPGIGGMSESQSARAERVESLRLAYEAGELNTPERASETAGRLLSGE